VQPARAGFIDAIQVFPYSEGALYQVYASPGHITDIALQEGEDLVEQGGIAAGDTARWVIGDTTSGEGTGRRIHILVKPIRPDLPVNSLVINTRRRTYHIELHPTAGTYMAAVSWNYPQDRLYALQASNAAAEAAQPLAEGIPLDRLRFRYAVTGDAAPWKPLRVFDDQAKVYIEFPPGIGQGEMPPLFVIGADGGAQLVNYRVRGHYYIVDRLFAAAELRLGRDPQQVARITRTDGIARPDGTVTP
jgi:type IV secretion system protein VirB9